MNCETFEASLTDLAREVPIEGILRAHLLEHGESCARCRARLEAERALTVTFRLAAADRVAVPDRIETALLAEYRVRHAQLDRSGWQLPLWRIRPLRYVGIAAAVLLALAGAAALTWRYSPRPAGRDVADSSAREIPQTVTARPGLEPAPAGAEAKTDLRSAASYPAAPESPVTPRVAPPRAVRAEEIATDFIPLTSSSDLSYLDSGQLVRVLLPRNAMASYGIPVNQELADKPVTAQVLIGQDGVARAIRFLGDPETRFVPTKLKTQR
jgi:hypothetical protein